MPHRGRWKSCEHRARPREPLVWKQAGWQEVQAGKPRRGHPSCITAGWQMVGKGLAKAWQWVGKWSAKGLVARQGVGKDWQWTIKGWEKDWQTGFGKRVGKELECVGKEVAIRTHAQRRTQHASVPVSGAEAVMRQLCAGHALYGRPIILAGDFNLNKTELEHTMQTTPNGREWGVLGNDKDFIMPCTYLRGYMSDGGMLISVFENMWLVSCHVVSAYPGITASTLSG